MAIKEKCEGDTVVLVPDRNITWRTQPELKAALDDLTASGRKNIVIDLTNVREISGYGLGLLASRCGRLRRDHGDIKLVNASDPVKRVLELTHLDDLFEQLDAADAAPRSVTFIHQGDDEEEED